VSIVQNDRAKPVHVVDFPGHQRLRSQLTTFLPITRGIIFVIDAVEFKADLTNNAQYEPLLVNRLTRWNRYLFDLFVDKTVNKQKIPFLIVCNKSEIITAKPKEIVQKDLEKEMYVPLAYYGGGENMTDVHLFQRVVRAKPTKDAGYYWWGGEGGYIGQEGKELRDEGSALQSNIH